MPFKKTYNFFNQVLTCRSMKVSTWFDLEEDSYNFIKKKTNKAGWSFNRIDTTNQIGFPDILIVKEQAYCLIEVKRLKKKSLKLLEDDLVWQFGQIGFACSALKQKQNYVLSVVYKNNIAFIGDNNVQSIISDTFFTGLI